MSCFKIFGVQEQDNSVLKKALKHHFKNEKRAHYVYNNVINSPEFNQAMLLKEDLETYDNGEVSINEYIEWEKELLYNNRINKTFSTGTFTSTKKEFIELASGFSTMLLKTLAKKGFTTNELFEAGEINVNKGNILNSTLLDVISAIESDIDYNTERKKLILNALKNNREVFYDAFNSYLISNLGISIDYKSVSEPTFNEDELHITENIAPLTDEIERNETKETKDASFNKSAHEYNQMDSAPNAIKVLIAGLEKRDSNGKILINELGLPVAVDYTNTFNVIQQTLVDIPADINLYLNELSRKASTHPELEDFVRYINMGNKEYYPSEDAETRAMETLLRTQFVNQFNKSRNEFSLHIKDDEGLRMINSNLDKIENEILRGWMSNFRKNLSENPNLFEDAYNAYGNNTSLMLKLLGIETDYSRIPSKTIDTIFQYGLDQKNSEEVFDDLYNPKKDTGVKSQLLSLAKLEAEISDDIVDLQFFNSENKLVYSITLNTYLSSLAKDLRYYAGDTTKLAELYPTLFSEEAIHSRNSEWRRKIETGERVNIGIYDGFKSKRQSSPSKKLKERDINVQRIIGMMLEGKFTLLRSADRGTENYFFFEGKRGIDALIAPDLGRARGLLESYLYDEINSMVTLTETGIANFDRNNANLRAFYIEQDGKKISLFEYLIKGADNNVAKKQEALELLSDHLLKGIDNLTTDEAVSKFIDIMVDQIIEKEEKHLTENGVLDTQNGSYTYLEDIIEKGGYDNKDNLVSLFAINSYLSGIEQSKIFIGDVAFYGSASDIFKRTSMLNSTKESARIDEEMNNYLSQLDHRFTGNPKNDYKKEVDTSIVTITLSDIEINASEFSKDFDKLLKDVFGKDYEKYAKAAYDNINEGDGFAYMNYDEYRIASIRFGEWLPSDEALYQQIASGSKTAIPEVMRRATVKKYQYTGKLMERGDNIDVIAGRKFSVIPLIPSVLHPKSVLHKLHTDMVQNDIGMAFYKSAGKFGTGVEHSLYNEAGGYGLDLTNALDFDVLDYRYMGNQLKIHNNPKSKITSSSQKRKLVEVNLYENGEVVDSTLKPLLEEYNSLQQELVNGHYNGTIQDVRFQGDDLSSLVNKKPLERFINILIEQGIEQGYTTNELLSLNHLKKLPIFDALPNKQRITNLVMARLRNRVISSKRKGDALAQVPDVGFEIDITEDIAESANRHNLKFYRRAKDGRMLPMEIMVPLPFELIEYVKNYYGAGKLTHEALEKFNEDIAEDNKLFESDPNHKSVLTDLTTYVGFRIPNQGASSSDVTKVKKFMPPYMGASIVVPKPIVAKTGSDFDIDKLNLYKPHVKVLYEGMGQITNDFASTAYDMLGRGTIREIILSEAPSLRSKIRDLGKEELISKLAMIISSEVESFNKPGTVVLAKKFQEFLRFKQKNRDVVGIRLVNEKEGGLKHLENKLLKVEAEITLHPANQRQLLIPLTSSTILDVVEYIRDLRGEPKKKVDHISDVFSNSKNVEKFISFLSGKDGVGQTAVHITNHALAQKANLQMKSLHNYFGLDQEWIDLGKINNSSGENISELLSEMLTSFVDIAKDDYIIDINAIQNTTDTILMLMRMGIPVKKIFLLLNQPIVRDFVKQKNLNQSVVTDFTDGKKTERNLVKEVLKDYGLSNVPTTKMIYFTERDIAEGNPNVVRKDKIYEDFEVSSLEDGIKTGGRDSSVQLQALDMYLEYTRQARIFREMISSTSPDTQVFKSISVLEDQIKARKKIKETGMFKNYDNMFKGFIGSFYDAKSDYYDIVSPLYLLQRRQYKRLADELKGAITNRTFNNEEINKVINLIENEAVSFFISNQYNFEKNFLSLFTGDNSIPRIVRDLATYYKDNDLVNSFLDVMLAELNTGGQGFDNLRPLGNKHSADQKETIEFDFGELKQLNPWMKERYGIDNFYSKLIKFAIIQSGVKNSPYNFLNFVPAMDYFAVTEKALTKALNGSNSIEFSNFTSLEPGEKNEFVLHNPEVFYGKRVPGVKVKWNRVHKTYTIELGEGNEKVRYLRKGFGPKASLYGGSDPILGASKEPLNNIDSSDIENC